MLALSIMYALAINLPEFAGIQESHFGGFMHLAAQWLIVSLISAGILGILSANRWVFAIFFPIIFVLSIVEVYFRHTLGAGITGTTIEIALGNNAEMWLSVIDAWLIIYMISALMLSIAIAIFRWKCVYLKGIWATVVLAICLLLTVSPLVITRIYGGVSNRMPYAIYNGTIEYLKNKKSINEKRDTFNGVEAKMAETPPNIIVVIGETLRGDHLPMNNYNRMTMPLLSKEGNLLTFKSMKSTGFHTNSSLPYILTRADSLNTNRGFEEQSFITIFKNAGYKSAWFANQDISSSYSYFTHETDTLVHVNSQRPLYSYQKWLDMDVIPYFSEWTEKNKDKPWLAIIHSIGSHWWTKLHYSDEDAVFLPDLDSKELSVLRPEQIINSYDNSIIATDRFLHSLIEHIKEDNALLIYVSDHGESLGEGGRWLHGEDAPELHDIASLVWYSPKYAMNFPLKIEALRNNVAKPSSSDDLFFSVIDAADIKTSVSDVSKSWFNEQKN